MPMRREGLLDLNEAVQNPGKRLFFDVQTELAHEEDLDLTTPVVGTLEAVSTGNVLLVKGDFRAKCVMECARCADPIELDLDFKMSDEFDIDGVPSCYGSDGYAQVVSDEPYALFDKNALVKDTYVRQGLLVNLPYQPLCAFGWEGPCPHAANLPHESTSRHGHPSMMGLEKFRKEER